MKRHLRTASVELALHYAKLLDAASTKSESGEKSKSAGYATFNTTLAHPLGITVVLSLVKVLSSLEAPKGEEDKKDLEAVYKRLEEACGSGEDSMAKPIEKVDVSGKGLPDSKKLAKLAIVGMS
jgi:hypothetical protein